MKLRAILLSLFALSGPARGDELQYLDHSEIALARLYSDISSAQSSIDLTYIIWDPCSSAAKVLTKKLMEKASAKPHPVKVRVLLDPLFNRKYHDAMAETFAKAGIELKFYDPPGLTSTNFHNHSKLALIDGKKMITGGRNIGDEYFGMAKKNYVDRDVAVSGESTAQARKSYNALWTNPGSMKIRTPPTERQRAALAACSKFSAKDAKLEKYLKQNSARILAGEKPVTCSQVSFAMDDMKHAGGRDPVSLKPSSQAVLNLVKGAKHTLTMENQYFIPDDTYMKGLLRERKSSGVKINVYSNMFDKDSGVQSVFDIENFDMVNFWHTKSMRSENGNGQTNHMHFRIAGAMDMWEFSPPNTAYLYHAKTFVADGKDAIVSSFNIDPRAMKINGESALVAKNCPAFAKRVEQIAKLTGSVWDKEEELQICLGGTRPTPPVMDPVTGLLEFFTKELQ